MKLCLVTLHLYVLSAWCVSLNTLDVSQTADIDVLEGEAVNISCCWTGMGSRVRVAWLKNQTLKDAPVSNNVVQEFQNNQVEKCSILNFISITKHDSGRFVCQVTIELPVLTTASGNGTVITVKSRGNQNDTTGVSLNTIDVSQTADIDVLEGEAVNISCCWTGMGNRVRVAWLKNQTLKDAPVSNNVVQEFQNNQVEKCSILNFISITKHDSGRYVCQVTIELPVLTTASGNGTVITVKSRGNQNDTTGVSLNTIDVSQTADIDVLEGEAVNISCCWTGTGNRVRVTWLKNQTLKDAPVSNNVVQETQNNQVEKCSILNFISITKQDSGRYVCQVSIEIPVLTTASGNGTVITAKSRGNQNDTTEESPSSTNKPAMTILPVVLPLLLVSITFFLYLREPKNHALTTTVIYSPLQRQQRSAGGDMQSLERLFSVGV